MREKRSMKKYFIWLMSVVVLASMLSGCDNTLGLSFPENPIKFETYDFTYPEGSDDGYRAFDYNGRTYLPYANQGDTYHKKDVDLCLGFIVQDGEEKSDEWIVTLKDFPNDDVLMIYFPYGMMDPPVFYRAIDTRGQTLDIPDYIDEENCYDYWKE